MRVGWSDLAIRRMHEIHDYIAEDNVKAAIRTYNRMKKAARVLEKQPFIGRPGRTEGTRELVVGGTPYLMMYLVRERDVMIITVVHGKQDWPPSVLA